MQPIVEGTEEYQLQRAVSRIDQLLANGQSRTFSQVGRKEGECLPYGREKERQDISNIKLSLIESQ